ncbi:unnamed protein product [Symbiodinium sp. KB8]|nr:unnamed protein product [Symbiodinium sp. KB8]
MRNKGRKITRLLYWTSQALNKSIGLRKAAEVAACGWVPLDALLGNCARPLRWSELHGPIGAPWDGFPSVDLPLRDLHTSDVVDEAFARRHFILWGLTLGIVNDWLVTTGLRKEPISLSSRL